MTHATGMHLSFASQRMPLLWVLLLYAQLRSVLRFLPYSGVHVSLRLGVQTQLVLVSARFAIGLGAMAAALF